LQSGGRPHLPVDRVELKQLPERDGEPGRPNNAGRGPKGTT
jgi:hypothetical protein